MRRNLVLSMILSLCLLTMTIPTVNASIAYSGDTTPTSPTERDSISITYRLNETAGDGVKLGTIEVYIIDPFGNNDTSLSSQNYELDDSTMWTNLTWSYYVPYDGTFTVRLNDTNTSNEFNAYANFTALRYLPTQAEGWNNFLVIMTLIAMVMVLFMALSIMMDRTKMSKKD